MTGAFRSLFRFLKAPSPDRFAFLVIFLFVLFLASPTIALDVVVTNMSEEPLQNAVIGFVPADGQPSMPEQDKTYEMVQKNYIFHPKVLPVPQGHTITFPNKDDSRHHIYSFSELKSFEFHLFEGKSPPLKLDKAGVLAIGCNIHDWMLSYIVSLPTPYFGKTGKSGWFKITDLPEGKYEIITWHRGQDNPKNLNRLDKTYVIDRDTESIALSIEGESGLRWPQKPRFIEKQY